VKTALGIPICFFAVFLALVPTPGGAQTISGLVAEEVSLVPVPHAVLTLFEVRDGALLPVVTGASDDSGAFHLQAPGPGRFQVQAEHDGLSSSVSDVIEVSRGDVVDDVALLVPSRLMMMAYRCLDEEAGAGAAVVGTLRDRASGIALPEAVVTARWLEGPGRAPGFATGASDGAGRYRLCGVAPGRVAFRASLLGREGADEEVDVPAAAVVIHDMEIEVGSVGRGGRDVVQERILVESAARGLGDLTGQIVDQGTDAPVRQAIVRIRGTGFQGITDGEGRFAFPDLRPGVYLLEIQHLGYSVQTSEVEVPAGRDVQLRLRVAPRAIEIAGIEVRSRRAMDESARLTPARRDVVYGSAMAREERRGASVADILRRSSPGLQVTEIYREFGPPILCISSSRRIQGLVPRAPEPTDLIGQPNCNETNPQIVLDGVRIDDLDVLRTLPSSEIESIEFLTPLQAQITHGIGGRTSNGVIVVYTRGRGPYVTELRNVP
jgi:hypothetical protein